MPDRPKLKISQPRFDAEALPDPLAGDKRCLQINREWIPMIIGCLDWMDGLYAWNGTQGEKELAVQYVKALIEHLATGVSDGCEGEILSTECCTEYPANHPVIQYAPNDPFQTPNLTPPGGYLAPPWKQFSSIAEIIPNTQEGDAIVPITSFPFGAAEPFNPENLIELIAVSGMPRFKFRFTGSGKIQLHLLKFPLGGLAYITHDGNPLNGKVVSTESIDLDEILPILILTGIAPFLALAHTIQDEIVEIEIEEEGDHYLDCTFFPRLEFIGPIPYMVGFGGGIRKIVLCGDIQAQEIPDMQVRLEGCELQWRPNDNTEWEALGNPLANLNLSAISIPYGNEPTVELTDCDLLFGIPEGGQGVQGENAPIPVFGFNELGNSVYLKIDSDADGNWDEISPNLKGSDGSDLSCDWQYSPPDNLAYFCRGARVAAMSMVHEMYYKWTVGGGSVVAVGENFQLVLPLSMQTPAIYLYLQETTSWLSGEDIGWLEEHYESLEFQTDTVKNQVMCLLFNSAYADPTLGELIAYGGTLTDADIQAAFELAQSNVLDPDLMNENLALFFYQCIAIQFHRASDTFRYAFYFESNLSCTTGIEDCTDCIPAETWCFEVDLSEGLPDNWHIMVGSYDGTTGIDTVSNVYGGVEFYNEFILRIEIAEDPVEITKISSDYTANWGTFHPGPQGRSSYEENSLGSIFLSYELDDVPNPLVYEGSKMLHALYFRMAAGSDLGQPATGSIKLTKMLFEGTGENPFGASNC